MFTRMSLAAALAAALAVLSGCGALPPRGGADVQRAINPITPPQRNVTDFTEALGCMDDLLLRFGVADITVLVEELQDRTQKLNAGTRDMMVSAVSDMTRRSRAIRLVTFGSDTNNAVNLQGQLEKRQPFTALPKYDIRGSITQFDEDVARDQADVGLPKINLPAAASSLALAGNRARQFGAVALDLSMINTADLTLVPGVTSKNLVVLTRDARTNQASAVLEKIGISFNFSYGRTESPAQALRAMVELATIELFGKLLRLPYWECLRVAADNPRVQKELDDWFFAMSRNRELTGFFQEQLRNRGLYAGPLDQATSPDLERAIAAFRRQVGIAPGNQIDRATFAALVLQRTGPAPAPPAPAPVAAPTAPPTAPSAAVAAAPSPSPAAASASPATVSPSPAALSQSPVASSASPATPAPSAAAPAAAVAPLVALKDASAQQQASALAAALASQTRVGPAAAAPTVSSAQAETLAAPRIQMSKPIYRAGEDVSFKVLAPPASYLYCFVQDNAGNVRRIFPNRFASDARVQSALPIVMPGAMGFALQAEAGGTPERVGCLTTPQDVSGALPGPLRIADFERISTAGLEDLAALFTQAAGVNVALGVATIEVNRNADAAVRREER
jgi:hypothetical protein